MAPIPTVNSGGLITAEFMNQIIARINDIDGRTGTATGTVTVPLLVGRTLGQARAILQAPSTQLQMGEVLNTSGAFIDTLTNDSLALTVINQMPAANARVSPGTAVLLLVPGTGGSSGHSNLAITSITPNPAATNSLVTINGQGFDPDRTLNLVTFDNVAVPEPPTQQSTTFQLIVRVPQGIPNIPTTQGQSRANVPVQVQSPGGSVSGSVAVGPASAQPKVTVNAIAATMQVNTSVQITGSNFSANQGALAVRFNGVAANITASTPTSITFTVPTLGIPPGSFIDNVAVVVSSTGFANSEPRTTRVQNPVANPNNI
jgi:hypothetical protein